MYKGLLLTLFLFCAYSSLGQQPDFENFRLRHKKEGWKVYETEAYDLYYTQGADTLVAEVLFVLQSVTKEIEDSLFANQSNKLHIILYPSLAALHESNIGIEADKVLPFGSIRFTGNRIEVAYQGSRSLLRNDLKEKLVTQYLQQRLYGDGFDAFLKSINDVTIPGYFMKSIPSFYSEGWTVKDDIEFKSLLLVPSKKTFLDLVALNPPLTGKALLQYLTQTQRSGSLSNFIYTVIQGKSVAQSAQLVYKKPLWQLQQSTLLYFVNRYLQDNQHQFSSAGDTLVVDYKISDEIIELKIARSQEKVALLIKNNSYYYLDILDSKTGKKNRILKMSAIPLSPVLTWDNASGQERLGIVYYEKGELLFKEFQFGKSIKPIRTSHVTLKNLDAVKEIAFTENRNQTFFIAQANGMVDIYELIGTRVQQVTDSKNEEREIIYGEYSGSKGLYFISDYESDTVRSRNEKNKMGHSDNLYFISEDDIEILKQKSKPYIVTSVVLAVGENKNNYIKNLKRQNENFYYQNLKNGFPEVSQIKNDNIAREETTIRTESNNVDYLILGNIITTYTINKNCLLRTTKQIRSIPFAQSQLSKEINSEKNNLITQNHKTRKEDKGLNLFGARESEIKAYKDSLEKARYFQGKNSRSYKLKLIADYTSASINNSLLINRYQSYVFNQGNFHQANVGGLIQYAFTDVLENYKVAAGVRLPANGKGSDFFILFENRRGLLDWGCTYLRHVEKFTLPNDPDWLLNGGIYFPPFIKQKTNYFEVFALNPFNEFQAVKLSAALRHDRQAFIATDTFSLYYPDTSQLWSIGRLEYQFDKTRLLEDDIRVGFRSKAFIEFHGQLGVQNSSFYHIGLDTRFYLKLYKQIVWANRFQAATSGGKSLGIMYTLGGTQNQLAPLVDSSTQFSPKDNYSLIAFATDLRGYAQNIRHGNSYVLINSEFRIPILGTFFNIQTKLNSLNKLKLVLFTDVGNAWKTPMLESKQLPQFVTAYGTGLHTDLFKYKVRMDIAWQNTSQGNLKRPAVNFSLGRNF